MVLGKRLAWASKDNRFWMGLYVGLSFSAGMLLWVIASGIVRS
jgi:hypothetical protein